MAHSMFNQAFNFKALKTLLKIKSGSQTSDGDTDNRDNHSLRRVERHQRTFNSAPIYRPKKKGVCSITGLLQRNSCTAKPVIASIARRPL